jgi:cytochrome d ubiquinol oxidase subunit I
MDALLLSRIQFAANISFHILFPTINIALCWFLVYFRLRHTAAKERPGAGVGRGVFPLDQGVRPELRHRRGVRHHHELPVRHQLARVHGEGRQHRGPLLGYEVLTAFFLEATFLGIMLFGRGRVSDRVHLLATLMVAAGTTLSAFWILSLNSWMQTPAGYTIIDGRFHATSWLEVIFNPSFAYRLTHKLLASTLTASFLIAGLSAWQLLRGTANRARGAR